jgi:hypothetical protein
LHAGASHRSANICPKWRSQRGAPDALHLHACQRRAEETYTGSLNSISAGRTLPENMALLWMVRAPVGIIATPGLLEQTYAADPAAPPRHIAPLAGERNNDIALHTMSEQGSAP